MARLLVLWHPPPRPFNLDSSTPYATAVVPNSEPIALWAMASTIRRSPTLDRPPYVRLRQTMGHPKSYLRVPFRQNALHSICVSHFRGPYFEAFGHLIVYCQSEAGTWDLFRNYNGYIYLYHVTSLAAEGLITIHYAIWRVLVALPIYSF